MCTDLLWRTFEATGFESPFLKGEGSSFVLFSYLPLVFITNSKWNTLFSFEALTRTVQTKGRMNIGTSVIVLPSDPRCSLQEQHQAQDEWQQPGWAWSRDLPQETRHLWPALTSPVALSKLVSKGWREMHKGTSRNCLVIRWPEGREVF